MVGCVELCDLGVVKERFLFKEYFNDILWFFFLGIFYVWDMEVVKGCFWYLKIMF